MYSLETTTKSWIGKLQAQKLCAIIILTDHCPSTIVSMWQINLVTVVCVKLADATDFYVPLYNNWA